MFVRVLVLEKGPFDPDEVLEHLRSAGPVALRGIDPQATQVFRSVSEKARRIYRTDPDPPTISHVSVDAAGLYMGFLTHSDTSPECPAAVVMEALHQWCLYGMGGKYVARVPIGGRQRLH